MQGNAILHWRWRCPSKIICSQVGEAGLGIFSFLKCCRRPSLKAKKKKWRKKSQGLAKVFSRYQPLQTLLSGVWEASQAELWRGMEPARYLQCRF